MFKYIALFFLFLISEQSMANEVLNVFVWGGEIPLSLIKKFEMQNNIKVNFNTFDSNESLYAKLKVSQDYDVIMPSNYYLEKLIKENKVLKLDLNKLSNFKNINPTFLNLHYDRHNFFSVPFTWGITGIFYNCKLYREKINNWQQLWQKKYKNKLLLIDDAREVFAIALISLGYSPNDKDLEHIKQAYYKLRQLQPNIKLLSSNAIQGLIIDEDVNIGMAWNGDLIKVMSENKNIKFSFPKKGFVLWLDCLAILKNSPHKQSAYKFIDFMLDSKNAKQALIETGMSSTNLTANTLLDKKYRNNILVNPPQSLIKQSIIIKYIGPKATKEQIKYWQLFKLNF